MKYLTQKILVVAAFVAHLAPTITHAEILAAVNYESKAEDSIRTLQQGERVQDRREGVAVVDVDPESENFGNWLFHIPLPADLIGHHLFYNNDRTKLYLTALGRSELRIFDLLRVPWRVKVVQVPECKMLEDMVFSSDSTTWWLTCLGSSNVIVGDAVTDEPRRAIALTKPYPHGIALHEGIDRILVTNSLSPTFTDLQETITEIEASTGRVLGTYKVSKKPSPAEVVPESVVFLPGSDPPIAYVTNDVGGRTSKGSLWAAIWNPDEQNFEVREMFDFAATESSLPIVMTFNKGINKLYVTSSFPGDFHIFDIADPLAPKLVRTIGTAPGAHHVAFSSDGRYAFVQNSMVNSPGMSDGSISVIDLSKEELVATVDSFRKQGLVHNSIILLPEWYRSPTQ